MVSRGSNTEPMINTEPVISTEKRVKFSDFGEVKLLLIDPKEKRHIPATMECG